MATLEKPYKPPVVAPGHTTATVTDKISEVVLQRTPKWWYLGFAVSFSILMVFLTTLTLWSLGQNLVHTAGEPTAAVIQAGTAPT